MPGSLDRSEGLGLAPVLKSSGVGPLGVLSAPGYDALVDEPWRTASLAPEARSVVVLATAGAQFFRSFKSSPEARLQADPLDRFLERVMAEALAHERSEGHAAAAAFYYQKRQGRYADFVALAQAAGLGAPSRLALLVNSDFGPWLAIRALLLTSRPLEPSSPDPDFSPCTDCPAPCVTACPGAAVIETGFDVAACFRTSAEEPACQVGCAARRACVLGPTHRYDPDAEAWHRKAALAHRTGRPPPRGEAG